MMPVVSKIFREPSQVVLMVRKRPHVVNGGGLVITNSANEVVFTIDGCGILGTKGELILKDSFGASVLFLRKKGGVIQALSANSRWKGFLMEYEAPSKLVFSLTDPKSCMMMNDNVRISVEPKGWNKGLDFKISGSFADKNCALVDRQGNIIAQVGLNEMNGSRDFYNLVVQPGIDQAFVVGVIAVLDNIHGESTTC